MLVKFITLQHNSRQLGSEQVSVLISSWFSHTTSRSGVDRSSRFTDNRLTCTRLTRVIWFNRLTMTDNVQFFLSGHFQWKQALYRTQQYSILSLDFSCTHHTISSRNQFNNSSQWPLQPSTIV